MNYKNIPSYEYITCDFWLKELAGNYDWNPGMGIEPVTFVEPSKLYDFFAACEENPRKTILITAASDLGFAEQVHDHPNKDIAKLVKGAAICPFHPPTNAYIGLQPFNAPVDTRTSWPNHRWSCKMDRFTKFTFDKVPSNIIHWFSSNLNAEIPNTTFLPFGLAPSHDPKQTKEFFHKHHGEKIRINRMYMNFTDYTIERFDLKRHYNHYEFMDKLDLIDDDLSAEEYTKDLTSYSACLCPFGNGFDCYRTLECWYAGTVPVMKKCIMAEKFKAAGLPVFIVDDLFHINFDELWEYTNSNPFKGADLSILTKSYWLAKLAEVRKQTGV